MDPMDPISSILRIYDKKKSITVFGISIYLINKPLLLSHLAIRAYTSSSTAISIARKARGIQLK